MSMCVYIYMYRIYHQHLSSQFLYNFSIQMHVCVCVCVWSAYRVFVMQETDDREKKRGREGERQIEIDR
jgi:hypothetical protein